MSSQKQSFISRITPRDKKHILIAIGIGLSVLSGIGIDVLIAEYSIHFT